MHKIINAGTALNGFLKLITLICLFSILPAIPVNAQDDTTKTAYPTADTLFHDVKSVPNAYVADKVWLDGVNRSLLPSGRFGEIEQQLAAIKQNFASLKTATAQTDLSKEYVEALSEYLRLWTRQKSGMDSWNTDVSGIVTTLSAQQAGLKKKIEVWRLTDSVAVANSAPASILQKIRSLKYELVETSGKLTSGIDRLLKSQNQLVEDYVQTELMLSQVKDYFLLSKRELFVQNSSTLWDFFASSAQSRSFFTSFVNIGSVYLTATGTFFTGGTGFLLVIVVYFLLLAGVIIAMSRFFKRITPDDPLLQRSGMLFNFPFTTLVFIFLFSLNIVISDVPEIFLTVIHLLMIFPIILIFRQISDRRYHRTIHIVGAFLVLQKLKLVSGSGSDAERILLTIITAFSIGVLLWVQLNREVAARVDLFHRYVKLLFRTLTVLMAIAFIANLFGYLMVSITIVNGVLNSINGIAVLTILQRFILGSILLFLNTDTAKLSLIVRDHYDLMSKKIAGFISVMVKILAVSVVLRSFGMFVVTWEFLESLLGAEINVGDLSLKVETIIVFFFSVWIAVKLAQFIRFILEKDILIRMDLDRGVPATISAVTFYLISGFGIIFAVVSSGLDMNRFSLLAGALGVGIGFGLQDIVKNFISGIILIFERPIHIGDAVQVDELSGVVRRIGIRSSVIKTWEGAEVIVPNGNLISNRLINWTFSDKQKRIDIPVGVAYGTRPEKVVGLLKACAAAHENVLETPPPNVFMKDLADSSIVFELRCWTADFDSAVIIRSDLMIAIEKTLSENGIEIPFPQRDINIKQVTEIKNVAE